MTYWCTRVIYCQGRALVVCGEPGVGKTALLEYLLEAASGFRAARGQNQRELHEVHVLHFLRHDAAQPSHTPRAATPGNSTADNPAATWEPEIEQVFESS